MYEGHIRNHFKDFHPIKINRITTAKVEKWISTRHKEGMNLSTIKKILVSLGQIMAYAVRHGYIDYNPVRDAERPRGNGKSDESKIRVLIPAEINAFNVYSHLMKPVNQEAALRLENAIFEINGSKQQKRGNGQYRNPLIFMVGTARFELATSTVSG